MPLHEASSRGAVNKLTAAIVACYYILLQIGSGKGSRRATRTAAPGRRSRSQVEVGSLEVGSFNTAPTRLQEAH